jgi:hypothetical protein
MIVSFYAGKTPDDRGRYLKDIQQWPDHRLESVHDFIQWMFPGPGPNWTVSPAPFFGERSKNWLNPYNHNHLRITRIIKCLRALGLETEARSFFDALSAIYHSPQFAGTISPVTFEYWQSAVNDG